MATTHEVEQLVARDFRYTCFMFKIRTESDGTTLKPRPGCDAVGYYQTSGSIEGTKITMVMEYDIDGDATTKEPKLELEGEWGGEEDKWTIKGNWKNFDEKRRKDGKNKGINVNKAIKK